MGWRNIASELLVMAMLGVFLAAMGPFGMFNEPFGRRLLEWLVFLLGGYVFYRPVLAAGGALSATAHVPLLAAIIFACLLATLPTTLLVAATLVGWDLPGVTLGTLIQLYPKVLLIGAGVTLILFLLMKRRASAAIVAAPSPALPTIEAPAPLPRPPPAPGAAFLDRLPPTIGRDLLAVENEDHYIRAHTALGSALLLMRLRDAVAELDGIDGARVHRGWWVARPAVAEILRRDRAVAFRLVNGLEVPVARNEAPALRAAGWL